MSRIKLAHVFLFLILISMVLAGCASESQGEKNAKSLILALYNCPDEAITEDFYNNQSTSEMKKKFTPFLAEDYQEEFISKYAGSNQFACYENSAKSKVMQISTDEKDNQVQGDVKVECTNKDGEKTEISMSITMQTDYDGKVNFFRLPSNDADYMKAVGAIE